MKQPFYYEVIRDEMLSFVSNLPRGTLRHLRSTSKYETSRRKMVQNDAPQEILNRLDALYDEWKKPAPPLPSVEERERLCIELIGLLAPNTTFKDESINWGKDGFRGHITRVYLPDPHRKEGDPLYTERDVEYHIQGHNLDLAHNNKEAKSWTAWVYVNRPGYLNAGRFKSVQGTDYGIQWYNR